MATLDALRLLTDALRADAALAGLVGDRVYTVLPKDKTFPLIRVVRWGGDLDTRIPGLVWLDRADFQIDAWATRQLQVYDVARCCVEALVERLPGRRPGGVVTASSVTSLATELDADFTPVLHRARIQATVTAHP
ncbi:tail completion protein gp17 [Streptomonospora salina]|uniref:DUF3168 domain-containing protein n=1 Tax=Streptomonospora salina TaxID=104205 RepID=A0A841EB56_9ACTN|nr:DUF3168 domain-containing protein [Streptomonospora salina]MBB6000216.1 hypothetical protein [Streptomonospora salina]